MISVNWANGAPVSGVYMITNTISGKKYVGSSINIKSRWESTDATKAKMRASWVVRRAISEAA